jgi:hypothetical protein
MSEIDVSVTVGEKRAITILPTATDVTLFSGNGYFGGWSVRDASGDVEVVATASVVAPGAATVIVQTATLPVGVFDVTWIVELTGAAAAADANNFQLVNGATQVLTSVNAGVAGIYPQLGTEVTVVAGTTVSIKSIGAGTAGVTYTGTLSLDPTQETPTVVEFQDGAAILGEVCLQANRSGTADLGKPGVRINGAVTVHVVSGKVTGAVYVTSDDFNG